LVDRARVGFASPMFAVSIPHPQDVWEVGIWCHRDTLFFDTGRHHSPILSC